MLNCGGEAKRRKEATRVKEKENFKVKNGKDNLPRYAESSRALKTKNFA